MTQIDWGLSDRDYKLVNEIADRWLGLVASKAPQIRENKQGIVMDLTACHNHVCRLDLEALASANEYELLHDVGGIWRHFDREKIKLRNGFWPRYAR